MKRIALLLVMTVALLSCNKEKSAVPTLDGDWLIGSSSQMNVSNGDTTYTNYEYVGDGVCCSPTFVSINASSYETGDVIYIGSDSYEIVEHINDGASLDDNYRYYVEALIVSEYNGCVTHYELFKLQND